MHLESKGADTFVVRDSPLDGTTYGVIKVRTSDIDRSIHRGKSSLVPNGMRVAGNGRGDIADLEHGWTYVVITDGAKHHAPFHSFDGRESLEQYIAIETMARVIDRLNRVPMMPDSHFGTLRTVRPTLPEPEPRVQLWPSGEWTEDIGDVWRLDRGALSSRYRAHHPGMDGQIALLEHALRMGGSEAARAMRITLDRSDLGGFQWYRSLPAVSVITCSQNVRTKCKEAGVHTLRKPEIRVSLRSRIKKPARTVSVPVWLVLYDRMVLREGYELTPELLAELMLKSMGKGRYDLPAATRYANALLGRAGERKAHRELERRYRDQIAGEVGDHLDVEVVIRPKEGGPT